MVSFNKVLNRKKERGGILIGVLVLIVVILLTLGGVLVMTTSHLSRAETEGDHVAALNVAEAGINYELHRISVDPSAANTTDNNDPLNGRYLSTDFGSNAKYYVYVAANADGSGTWHYPAPAYIFSTGYLYQGTSRETRRMVRIRAEAMGAFYTAYGVDSFDIQSEKTKINGIIGTEGLLSVKGQPSISQINFNGQDAGWDNQHPSGYNVVNSQSSANWKSTFEYIKPKPDSTDFSYYADHNDNNLAIASDGTDAIGTKNNIVASGSTEITLVGKKDGVANYYLENITMNQASFIHFDNRAGPINLWFNPTNSGGTYIHGGDAEVHMEDDPTKPVRMFMARKGRLNIGSGLSEFSPFKSNPKATNRIDMGIYDLSPDPDDPNRKQGAIALYGNTDFYGQIVCDDLTISPESSGRAPTLTGRRGYFEPREYVGFAGEYMELHDVSSSQTPSTGGSSPTDGGSTTPGTSN